jgi:ketosteroid isomerase-like protein
MTDRPTNDLAALLARAAIADLTARYCDRLDAHDIDAVAACFTPDAETDYGPGRGGVVVGRDAIRARIGRGQSVFRRTHHQLGHQTVTVGDGSATGVTAAITWHERHTGERELLALRYLDEFRWTDGHWLIARRRVEISMVDGFAGTEWHWWPRRPPAVTPQP